MGASNRTAFTPARPESLRDATHGRRRPACEGSAWDTSIPTSPTSSSATPTSTMSPTAAFPDRPGWVTTLVRGLEKRLAKKLGRVDSYDLWRDAQLAGHVGADPGDPRPAPRRRRAPAGAVARLPGVGVVPARAGGVPRGDPPAQGRQGSGLRRGIRPGRPGQEAPRAGRPPGVPLLGRGPRHPEPRDPRLPDRAREGRGVPQAAQRPLHRTRPRAGSAPAARAGGPRSRATNPSRRIATPRSSTRNSGTPSGASSSRAWNGSAGRKRASRCSVASPRRWRSRTSRTTRTEASTGRRFPGRPGPQPGDSLAELVDRRALGQQTIVRTRRDPRRVLVPDPSPPLFPGRDRPRGASTQELGLCRHPGDGDHRAGRGGRLGGPRPARRRNSCRTTRSIRENTRSRPDLPALGGPSIDADAWAFIEAVVVQGGFSLDQQPSPSGRPIDDARKARLLATTWNRWTGTSPTRSGRSTASCGSRTTRPIAIMRCGSMKRSGSWSRMLPILVLDEDALARGDEAEILSILKWRHAETRNPQSR